MTTMPQNLTDHREYALPTRSHSTSSDAIINVVKSRMLAARNAARDWEGNPMGRPPHDAPPIVMISVRTTGDLERATAVIVSWQRNGFKPLYVLAFVRQRYKEADRFKGLDLALVSDNLTDEEMFAQALDYAWLKVAGMSCTVIISDPTTQHWMNARRFTL